LDKKSKTTSFRTHAITPLIVRVMAFLGIFIVLSGLIGPKIISGGILYRDYFDIYGSLGKALLFAAIAFVLLVRSTAQLPSLAPWKPRNAVWLLCSAVTFFFAWQGVNSLLRQDTSLTFVLGVHGWLIASVLLAFAGTMGLDNIRRLVQTYKRQFLLAWLTAVGFLLLLVLLYSSWGQLSTVVMHSVRWLLELSGVTALVIPPHSLLMDKFGITIAQSCSGIESIALFTALYALIGFLDWDKLNHRKFLWAFPAALALLFICNIFRVYFLIMSGYYIDQHIAFTLFHTYAGMVFFIIYAVIFWKLSYIWMLRKN
jgi:exosortase/archaeosortase family protein